MKPNGLGFQQPSTYFVSCGKATCVCRGTPGDPANWQRVMTVWRANMLGSPGEGMGYFLRHPLSADDAARARESRRLLAIGKYHERYLYQVRPASRG
jgi:nitrate reductase alpha subunit